MYTDVKIENYRGIKTISIHDMQQFNLFVGKNNCGKTSVLEALFLLSGSTNAIIPLKVNRFRGFDNISDTNLKTFFYGLKESNTVRITGEWENPYEKRELLIKPRKKLRNSESYKRPIEQIIENKDQHIQTNGHGYGLEMSFLSRKRKEESKVTPSFFYWDGSDKIEESSHFGQNFIINGHFHNQRTIKMDLRKKFEYAERNKQTDQILEIMKKIQPNLTKLSPIENTIYCEVGFEQMIPIDAMGDGFVSILAIVLNISASENGVMFVDEIASDLHYSSQMILWDAIFSTSKQFNVQFFGATHSIECIKAYAKTQQQLLINDDNIRLYRLEKQSDDICNTIKFNSNEILNAIESEWEIR